MAAAIVQLIKSTHPEPLLTYTNSFIHYTMTMVLFFVYTLVSNALKKHWKHCLFCTPL